MKSYICNGVGAALGEGCGKPFETERRRLLRLCPECCHTRAIRQMREYRDRERLGLSCGKWTRRKPAAPAEEIKVEPDPVEAEDGPVAVVKPGRVENCDDHGVAASFGDRFQEKYRRAVVAKIGGERK
jgi:hypothetical protein